MGQTTRSAVTGKLRLEGQLVDEQGEPVAGFARRINAIASAHRMGRHEMLCAFRGP